MAKQLARIGFYERKFRVSTESVINRKTYGLGRFFSSVYNKPIPGMCHLQLSLIPVEEEKSYPLITRQIQQNKKPKSSRKKPSESESKRKKKKSGRPEGGRNQNRRDAELTETQKILMNP